MTRAHADLAPCRQLITEKIHGPDIVGSNSLGTIITRLGLNPSFGRLVTQLHAHLLVNAIGLLPIALPALPSQQNVLGPVAESTRV